MNFFSLFKRNLLYILKKKINIDLENIEKLSLDDLFSYYDTDKANFIKSKNEPGHGFSKFYETHLNLFKEKKINILEIGSYSGAAAAAFVKYFPNSEIYCLDINLRNFKYSSKKIHPYGTDVSNTKMMLKFLSKINFFDSIKYFDFPHKSWVDFSEFNDCLILKCSFRSNLLSPIGSTVSPKFFRGHMIEFYAKKIYYHYDWKLIMASSEKSALEKTF